MAIPKIIHYCWFGNNPMPKNAIKCINSWKKFCPDYEIRKWTENDFDINSNLFTKQAYEQQAWGFVPDYIRLWIIYHYGGIYLDTDVQVIRSLDTLLSHKAFAGLETTNYVAFGLGFGAEKGNELIYGHMIEYDNMPFVNTDGSINNTPSPQLTTKYLEKYGFEYGKAAIQVVNDMTIYPSEYFCPKDFVTGLVNITHNTFSIHQFDASWYTPEQQAEKEKRWKKNNRDFLFHTPNRIIRKAVGDKRYEEFKKWIKK